MIWAACRVFLTVAISHWHVHLTAVHMTVTTTPGLLRGNEPGNEAGIDSLCETLTGKITLYCKSCINCTSEPVGNWVCQLCIPSIKGQSHEITTFTICALYIYVTRIFTSNYLRKMPCDTPAFLSAWILERLRTRLVWNRGLKGQSSLMDFIPVSSR